MKTLNYRGDLRGKVEDNAIYGPSLTGKTYKAIGVEYDEETKKSKVYFEELRQEQNIVSV